MILRLCLPVYGRDGKILLPTIGCAPVRSSLESRMSSCVRFIPHASNPAGRADSRWRYSGADSNKVVTIRSEVSKTRTRRFVALSENAVEWLKLCPTKSPSTRIVPFSFNVLRKKRRANWLNAREGKKNWIHQGMLHTFCSCWLAKYEDVNKLLLMSGHSSPQMLWRNYYRAVEKSEAEKFWSIYPPHHF